MRILYVVLRRFETPRQAITRRHAAIARALQELGHQVDPFPLTNDDTTSVDRTEDCPSASSGMGLPIRLLDDPTACSLLSLLHSGHYDAVILTHPYCTEFTVHAKRLGIPSIVCAHNFESGPQMKRSRNRSALGQATVIAAELLYLHKATRVWMVSPRDELHYKKVFGLRNTRFLPIGMDVQRDLSEVTTSQPTIAFVGAFTYPPNREAASYMANVIFPLVRAKIPQARLILAGARADPETLALQSDTVKVLTDLEEISSVYEVSDAVVAPIRTGGGSNFKVIEAMAYGKAVVASSLALRGLSDSGYLNTVRADSVEDLVSALELVLTDRLVRASIGRSGRNYVQSHYSSSLLVSVIEQEMKSIREDPKPARIRV